MENESNLLKQLRFDRNLTQEKLADSLGVTKGYISLVEQGRSKLSEKVRNKIADIYSIDIEKNSKNTIQAKLYLDVIGSCGNGAFEQSQNYELVELPSYIASHTTANREYSIVTAKGESMSPTILNGDKIIAEEYQNEGIVDNDIYIFCYENALYIKRLVKNIDQIIVKSDNKEIPTRYIEKDDMNNIHIIARVIGSLRSY